MIPHASRCPLPTASSCSRLGLRCFTATGCGWLADSATARRVSNGAVAGKMDPKGLHPCEVWRAPSKLKCRFLKWHTTQMVVKMPSCMIIFFRAMSATDLAPVNLQEKFAASYRPSTQTFQKLYVICLDCASGTVCTLMVERVTQTGTNDDSFTTTGYWRSCCCSIPMTRLRSVNVCS